jgi:hypothetical protein
LFRARDPGKYIVGYTFLCVVQELCGFVIGHVIVTEVDDREESHKSVFHWEASG